jgi:sortase A
MNLVASQPTAKILRIVGISFTGLGGLMLLFVLYELVGTSALTRIHQSTLRNEFVRAAPALLGPTIPAPRATAVPRTPKAKRGHALARLLIPKIGVDVIVVEGVALDDLAKGPGHYRETPLPGATGSTGIAGHRTGWGAPFYNLDRVRTGDMITLVTKAGRYIYRVTGRTIVKPSAVWVLDGDPDSHAASTLTLTTCTPRFTARDRLVVWADLVRASAARTARAAA